MTSRAQRQLDRDPAGTSESAGTRPLVGDDAESTYWSSSVTVGSDRVVLTLHGELDLASEDALAALLTRLEAVPHLLIVDLADVTYGDSNGLRALFESAQRRRHARLPALLLSSPSTFLARVLCVLGAQRVFDTEHGEHCEQAAAPTVWYAC